jgi:hypothetical protein
VGGKWRLAGVEQEEREVRRNQTDLMERWLLGHLLSENEVACASHLHHLLMRQSSKIRGTQKTKASSCPLEGRSFPV